MSDDSKEWGPWIQHDGKGCPVIGEYVQAADVNRTGRERTAEFIAGNGGGFSWDWQWSRKKVPGYNCYATRIIRYRIRKPRALSQLRDMVESLPAPEKERERT